MDCLGAFHQVKLSERSKELTAFLLPWGKFRYCSAGMGLVSSGDEWNIRSDDALQGTPCEKEVHDLLLQNETYDGLAKDLREVLTRCKEHNITISRKKIGLSTPQNDFTVMFAGFAISRKGCEPDDDKIAAISQFA